MLLIVGVTAGYKTFWIGSKLGLSWDQAGIKSGPNASLKAEYKTLFLFLATPPLIPRTTVREETELYFAQAGFLRLYFYFSGGGLIRSEY